MHNFIYAYNVSLYTLRYIYMCAYMYIYIQRERKKYTYFIFSTLVVLGGNLSIQRLYREKLK